MKDNYGDKLYVCAEPDTRSVYLELYQGSTAAAHEYTPKKARKLARKLNEAADEIDPRPEPASAMDGGVKEELIYLTKLIDKSRGYQDGDVVLFTDCGAVVRYDAEANAWYSAGPEQHDCSAEFDIADPGSVILIARHGQPYVTVRFDFDADTSNLAATIRRHIRTINTRGVA